MPVLLSQPPLKLFNHLNVLYDYDPADIKYLHARLHLTIKQDSYMTAVEDMMRKGMVSRGHRVALLRLVDQVQTLLKAARVQYWLIGDGLRDAVCFRNLLQTTTHVELAVRGDQFKSLLDSLDALSSSELAISRQSANPDIVAIQYARYQGIGYPFVVLYAYTHYDGTYAFAQNASTSIQQSELFPLQERFLDYLALPVPGKALKFLRDQYPFFLHGLLITAYETPVLMLFERVVRKDRELHAIIKTLKTRKKKLAVSLKPRIQH